MTRRIIRTATIAIAIAAFAAPTALARPADMPPAVAKAAAATKHKQDARSAETDGFPTRPVIDRPSPPPNSRPHTTPTAPADPGIAWTTIAIGIAGSLLVIGVIAGITSRTRRTGRARITA
jgi:hypothetical protein